MNRSKGLLVLVLVAALGGGAWWMWGRDGGGRADGPNILIISLDTVRADHMGFLGKRLPNGESPTPNLDALAARSAAMQEGVTPAPLTLPAHVSVMSGLYPDRHGARENDSFRVAPKGERDFALLAEVMRDRGYRTGAVVSGQPLEARYGLDAGFSTYHDTDSSNNPNNQLRFRERGANETTKFATDWIEKADDSKPWFFFAHYFDAHDPYQWHGHAGLDAGNRKDRYLSEIMFLDAWVGRLIDSLPEGGRGTAVFVFADHGEGLGDHGEETHGFTLHQSTLRVPFLFKPPEGRDASAFAADGPPARLVDVFPTVLALAGAGIPTDLDGRSLLDAAPDDWHAFAETLYPYYQFQYAHDRCCQSRDRKLISGGGRAALFDWKNDRGEASDLAANEPDAVRGLDRWLNGHLTRSGRSNAIDVLVEPNAAFPYMGGRPLSFPVEPSFDDNKKLPPVETRWDVVRALDRARMHLSAQRREPNLASAVLAPFAKDLDSNPALLWWTARAVQLESRNEDLLVETRVQLADRAIALFRRHHVRFKDARALDALLGSLRDKHDGLGGGHQVLMQIVKEAGAASAPTALTLALKARALEHLGEFEKARDALRQACRMETDPRRRQNMSGALKRVEKALETVRDG